MRFVTFPVENPKSSEANLTKPFSSPSDREPSSVKCRQHTVHIHRGSLRRYKWWVRSRVVFRGCLGSEYANGREEIIGNKGQLDNKGSGGKIIVIREKVNPQGSNFKKHPCSSNLSAEPRRHIH